MVDVTPRREKRSNAGGSMLGSENYTALLPRYSQLDHYLLLPFVADHETAMEENAVVFFKMSTGHGLAPRMLLPT